MPTPHTKGSGMNGDPSGPRPRRGATVSEPRLCMYGFPHPDEDRELHGFACQREEHARAAVFGR